MTPIHFVPASLCGNEKVKRDAAIRQTLDLIDRIDGGKMYRLLTQEDRDLLKNEGYAQDLLNNIIFLTQRVTRDGERQDNYHDRCLTGFTHSAFDPSIYASSTIKNNLIQLSQGCCMYCESPLYAAGAACVSHYRPASTINENTTTLCSPYYSLAYNQENLLYSCHECSDVYKRDQFPVEGHRFPLVELELENNILLSPYKDNVRDFIRFNPLNARAYSFDTIIDFYQDWKSLSAQETAQLLFEKPHYIPNQKDTQGNQISDAFVDNSFTFWHQHNAKSLYRGKETINILGLNRPGLLYARHCFLKDLYNRFLFDQCINEDSLRKEYKSLAIDAIHTWLNCPCLDEFLTQTPSSHIPSLREDQDIPTKAGYWKAYYQNQQPSLPLSNRHYIPAWMTSSLMYTRYQEKHDLLWPRRLVLLNSDDAFYGRKTDKKCIFTSINWDREFSQPILVKSPRHTWSATFRELSESHQSEIVKLFSENELWVLK